MKFERNPATVHAEQLVPGKIRESIEILDGFIAGGSFDYNLDAENDEDLAAVLTCTHRSWETLLPSMWVVRWADGEYTIMDDEDFRRDFKETPEMTNDFEQAPEVGEAVDRFLTDPSTGTRRTRPQRDARESADMTPAEETPE